MDEWVEWDDVEMVMEDATQGKYSYTSNVPVPEWVDYFQLDPYIAEDGTHRARFLGRSKRAEGVLNG